VKLWKIVSLALLVTFLSTPSTLHAQAAEQQAAEEQAAGEQAADDQAAAARGKFTGEITVTAQKREEALIDVPISIKAITSDDLETINAQELADIVRLVPSMSMTDLQRGGNNVQIRGLGSNVGNVGTVALYNDGIISATRTQSDGTFAEQDPTLFDVERVEVLRGPQGTLYGEGSFGGVINFISRRPDPSRFSASFSGDFFSIKDGDSSNYNAGAMVNIPLVKDRWAVRLVAHSRDRGGYIDGVDVLPLFFGQLPEFVGEDLNTEKFYGGRVLLGYTGEKVFANLIVKSQKTELGIANFTSASVIDFVNQLIGSSFDPELSQTLFGSTFGSEETTNEAVLDINVATPIGLFTSITGWGDVEAEIFSDPGAIAENDAFSQEFRLSSESSGALNYTVGAYYRSAERLFELGPGGGIPFGFTSMDQWSVYGQLYWDISQQVRATLGAAYAEFDSEVRDDLNPLPAAKNTFDDVSPKLALNWQPNDSTNAYVSAAKGFRAGGANIDESLGTDPTYSEGFDPDTIWNYEVGVKKAFADGRVALNTAVFYIDWSDIQIDRPITSVVTPPVQFIVVNGGDAHSFGIEADLYWNPGKGWDIVLGGSVIEPEYDSGSIESVAGPFELEGQTLPSAPKELWNASVSKTFPIGGQGLDGFVRVDYSHRGNSFADVPNERPGADLNSGEFDLVNLRLGVRQQGWEFQVFAKNLTNEDASAWSFDIPAEFTSLRARIAPLTVGMNIKFFYN
jgi:outer membrane receptor protein involved in Fe transport